MVKITYNVGITKSQEGTGQTKDSKMHLPWYKAVAFFFKTNFSNAMCKFFMNVFRFNFVN